MKRTTIFKQLIFNVVFPAFVALILLGILNYIQTRSNIIESNRNKNLLINDEIKNIHELQDLALDILEDELDPKMHNFSKILVNEYFRNTKGIDEADLNSIRLKIGMDPGFEDIYIISRMGIVVNTTFVKDRNLNLFSFGEDHKKLLEGVFNGGVFLNERFTIESSTKRLKKYSYQPTLDGKYLIELGIYSPKADTIIQTIKNRINDLGKKQESIKSVDIFIGKDNPFSLNKDAQIERKHMGVYSKVLSTGQKEDFTEESGKKLYHYEFVYMLRKNTDLYKESVIRIISDRSGDRDLLRRELLKYFVIFGISILIVIFLIYRKMRVITDPIKNLLDKVNRITNGHLDERADIVGNNEISSLSEQFNAMIAQLESYYNELEEKVRQRTAEIMAQKEEIEAQRDSIQEQRNILSEINKSLQKAYLEIEEQKKHIEDSIHYAKRIQNAILPPDEYVHRLLPDSFILYKPKDIVSGDFYWMNYREGKAIVAAVDCTGHGVPGAFMSIVGNNQLNYAVNVQGKVRPDEILNALNEGVTKALRQTRLNSSVKDGMDISLAAVDFKNKKLQYAGAYNPLFMIRDGELIQIKANKFPIGGYMGEELRNFTLHELDIKQGDIIYIFSDGYVDQFGGTDDSKYLIKRFRDLLLNICNEPMEEQKEILNQVHLDWRGGGPQIDDILVIGIKI
jgi:phosphoserine phosphatase RsbU/P